MAEPPAFPLRVVFMGTADIACASLAALHDAPQFDLTAVVTQPDRPKGREMKLHPSAVKELALQKGIAVLQPEKARDPAFVEELRRLEPSLIVVVAYGQILPRFILELPPYGCVNVHASLLPKYRGAAPIQSAILNDEAGTGVTIMQMDAGMDTGPILAQTATTIAPEDDAQTLHDRLGVIGAELLLPTLIALVEGRITPCPQRSGEASYTRKITREDGRIDWALPARTIWNRVRAFTPWPGAFTHWTGPRGVQMLKLCKTEPAPASARPPGMILSAEKSGIVVACGQDALRVTSLQLQGGRRLDAAQFLAGHPLRPGDSFR